MKVLVIAPHPDDEVLGCGGTIVKHVSNDDIVYLCIVTKTYTPDWTMSFAEKRKKEIKNANRILGIEKTYLLDFPTVKLDTIPQKELNDSIAKIVRVVNPDILYIPHQGDLNKDHRLVFDSALVSIRFNNKIIKVRSYEVLSSTEWGRMYSPFIPNTYVDITKTFEKKINAMIEYGKELKGSLHPRSIEIIEALAKRRGSEVGLKYAEAFMLIREIG